MAKKAKTTADQSALNAVENALSIDFEEMGKSEESELTQLEKNIADTVDTLREGGDTPSENVEVREIEESTENLVPESPPLAANDDHDDDLNELLYAIQQKPKSRVFLWSLIASAMWLTLCGYYGYINVWPAVEKPISVQTLTNNLQGLILIAVAFIPLMPLWGLAIMMRRALDMRHAAGTMTQVSLRLLQPEKISTDSIATVGTAIRREMTAIGDGVERAIARAGELEFMVQKEVMNLERSYGDSEVRLRRLIEDIGNEREEVVTHAEKLRTSISESQNGFTSEIESATNRIDETLKIAAGNLSQQLDTEVVTITSRLKDTSDGLLEILSTTGAHISDSLGEGTEKLRQNVESQVREMSEVVSTSGQAIATLIDGRTASFDTAATNVTEKLEMGKKAFDITFNERNEDLGKILATAGQSVSTLVKSSTAELAEHSNNMLIDFEENRKKLESTFNHQSDQFGKLTELAADNMTSAFESGSDRFEESATKVAQQIEDNLTIRATDFESRINETGGNLETTIAENIDKVNTSLSTGAAELNALVTEKVDLIENTLTTSGNNLVSALGMRTEALDKVLRERAETIGETIAERLSGFGQNLTGHVDEAVSLLKVQTDELQENTKSVEEFIAKRTQSVEDAIKSSTIEFASGLRESLLTTAEKSAELNTALSTTARNLLETTEHSTESIAQALEQTNQTISQKMAEGTRDLTRSLSDQQEELTANLTAKQEELTASLTSTQEELTTSLTSKQEELTSNLNANARYLQEAMDERANNLSSKLNQGIHRISSALVTKGTEAAEDFERVVGALEERMHNSSHSIEMQFAAGSKILRESLDEGQATLLNAVSESVSHAATAIDGKAEKLSELLTERANVINESLGGSLLGTQRELEAKTAELNELLSSRSTEITASLDERIGELNASLSARSSELSNIIEQDAKPVIASLETTGEAINNQLADMGKLVADQANTLFSNLTSSNEQLESLINSAGSNLSLMQTALSQQSSDFAETVNISKAELESSNKIAIEAEEKLQSASANLMQNMGSIANRLEAQGSVLQDATRLIDAAQTNLEQTLDEKQQALQDLSSGLMLRSDEINSSVSSFAQMISSMVDDLAAKSQGTGGAIAAEVSSAIDDATIRFGDSVDAMRSAAATIRKELDDTREQMRRGVLELPDETAQTAAAMRRVVTDQIAALKDLSSIVERSGKVLDTSAAMPQVRAAVGHGIQPARQPRPAPAASIPSDTRPVNPAPAFDPPLHGSQPAFAPAPAAQAPRTHPSADPQDSSGWVSDLLRRASTDEPPRRPAPLPDTRSPDHMVESLNSLSMDIASAIDHEASIDLWERYQRGETNVFTRRLYTLKGQQTFDEIRSKYAQNGDFRNAVNRYIEDFERLLSDVSRTDQGGTMAQNYLTSDTGKVYTMLAHAAGRFGT